MPQNKVITGRFKPGTSGNPGGRPRLPEEIKLKLRGWHSEAWDRLHQLMRSDDEAIALKAAHIITQRCEGQHPEPIVDAGEEQLMSDEELLSAIDALRGKIVSRGDNE